MKTEAEKRAERLAKALRANLGRRKSQTRGRDALSSEGRETADADAKMPQDDSE
ncbi:hypothetical protein J8I29_01335 [Labrys sp. LIt4]|uniref:hypothetical protein n=1 Tax=Labrys TaxID=204476 RepID=UPI0015E3DA3A|nr:MULTISPECIES: hypothetical protein [Labrys]MBP0577941.1 hypothetical protein [Labrys sp. LIt4]